MPTTHLSKDGSWRICRAGRRACPMLLHLPDTTPEMAAVMPWSMVEPLLEAIDPGQQTKQGSLAWYRVKVSPQTGQASRMYHRDYDLPALIHPDGTRIWFRNGQIQRGGGKPAIVRSDGTREWYAGGRPHRDNDLPAIEHASGDREWYFRGKLHRDGDLPAIDGAGDGRPYQAWFKHGDRHREGDLPAEIDVKGVESWYQHDLAHRTTGPAVVYRRERGEEPYFYEWWLNDELLTESEWQDAVRRMDQASQV